MAPILHKSHRRSWIGSVVVILVLILLIGIIIFFFLNNSFAPKTNSSSVVFKITGEVEKAIITYNKARNQTETKIVEVPWTSKTIIFPSGSILVLTAAGSKDNKGGVRCTILVNGQIVDTNENNPFVDKALCGTVIP